MPVPSARDKILPARGNFADLQTNVASLLDGEICYAIDQDQYYQNEEGTLVSVGATKAQGLLADSALQSGDNVSALTNDAGYITLAEVPGDAVTSVNTQTGDVVLAKGDVGLGSVDNTSDADKPVSAATQTALDSKADLVGGVIPNSQLPSLAISEYLGTVVNEAALLTLSGQRGDWAIRTDTGSSWVITTDGGSTTTDWTELATPADAVTSVNGFTGTVVLGPADVGAATTAQGSLADTAIQPEDNISTLTNDAGYITLAEVPADGVTSVNTQTGAVVLDADDISDAATANKFTTQAELDKLAGIEASAQVNTVNSVAGKTGDVTLVKADVTDFSDSDYATAAQGLLADSATQPGDNISTLANNAGYITLAEVPADVVTSVNTQTGGVVLDADDISDAATTNKFATQAELNKLAGIEAGAQVNTVTSVNGETGAVTVSGSTDLSYTASTRELASSTGNNVTLPEAVASGDSGLLSGADKATIDGLATVATSGDYTDLTNTPAAGLSLTGDDLIIQLPGYFGTVDGNGTEQNENIRIGQPYYNSTAKRGGDQIVITDSEGWATLEHVNCSNFGVAIGRGFDRFNTTGAAVEQNVLIGDNAGGALSSGDGDFYHNTVIGFEAGASLRGSYENVLIGMQAGYGIDVTTGTGYYASVSPASGAVRNTFLGYQAGYDINNGDNNIAIGYQAGRASSPSGALEQSSNVVVLGNNSINNFYCADTSISSSDARDKTDVEDFTPGLSFIQALRPVTYRWDKRAWYLDIDNPDEDILDIEPTGEHKREKLHLGFIAQEMEAVEQAHGFANDKNDQLIVNLNEDDTAYGVKYERLVPVLVNAIKELKAEIEELKSGINS